MIRILGQDQSFYQSQSKFGNLNPDLGINFEVPFRFYYLAHVIEQPIFQIPNLEYLQRNFVYLLDQQ